MAQLLTGLFNGKFGDRVTGPPGVGNLQLGTDWSPMAGRTNKHPILWCLQCIVYYNDMHTAFT